MTFPVNKALDLGPFLEDGQGQPAADSRHHSVQIGSCLIKWEGHTEATSHTIMVPGNGQPPFAERDGLFDDLPIRRYPLAQAARVHEQIDRRTLDGLAVLVP